MAERQESTGKTIISSGNPELDAKMGGGLPAGSLVLIEGTSGAGKSVLSQQLLFGALQGGFQASVFTTENTVKSMVSQMRSIDLEIMDYLLLRKFRVYPVELAHLGAKAPGALLNAIRNEQSRDLIVVDSFSSAITHTAPDAVISFFESSKRLSGSGTTVILVLHSGSVVEDLMSPIRSMCDAHLQLRTEQDGQRLVKTLQVVKIRGAGSSTGSIVGFDVEPGWGIRVIPINKARA